MQKTTVKIVKEEENTVRNFDCAIESAGLKFYSQNAAEEKGKELEIERGKRKSRRRSRIRSRSSKARSAVNSHCLSAAGKLCID